MATPSTPSPYSLRYPWSGNAVLFNTLHAEFQHTQTEVEILSFVLQDLGFTIYNSVQDVRQIKPWLLAEDLHTDKGCLLVLIICHQLQEGHLVDGNRKVCSVEELIGGLCGVEALVGKPKIVIFVQHKQYYDGKTEEIPVKRDKQDVLVVMVTCRLSTTEGSSYLSHLARCLGEGHTSLHLADIIQLTKKEILAQNTLPPLTNADLRQIAEQLSSPAVRNIADTSLGLPTATVLTIEDACGNNKELFKQQILIRWRDSGYGNDRKRLADLLLEAAQHGEVSIWVVPKFMEVQTTVDEYSSLNLTSQLQVQPQSAAKPRPQLQVQPQSAVQARSQLQVHPIQPQQHEQAQPNLPAGTEPEHHRTDPVVVRRGTVDGILAGSPQAFIELQSEALKYTLSTHAQLQTRDRRSTHAQPETHGGRHTQAQPEKTVADETTLTTNQRDTLPEAIVRPPDTLPVLNPDHRPPPPPPPVGVPPRTQASQPPRAAPAPESPLWHAALNAIGGLFGNNERAKTYQGDRRVNVTLAARYDAGRQPVGDATVTSGGEIVVCGADRTAATVLRTANLYTYKLSHARDNTGNSSTAGRSMTGNEGPGSVPNTGSLPIRHLNAPCGHPGMITSVTIGNQDYAVVTSPQNAQVYAVHMGTGQPTLAYFPSRPAPTVICHGPPGRILLYFPEDWFPVRELNVTSLSFWETSNVTKTGFREATDMCYVPAGSRRPSELLVLCNARGCVISISKTTTSHRANVFNATERSRGSLQYCACMDAILLFISGDVMILSPGGTVFQTVTLLEQEAALGRQIVTYHDWMYVLPSEDSRNGDNRNYILCYELSLESESERY